MNTPCHARTSHVTHLNESCHAYQWVVSHISMSHVTHINESCNTYEWAMPHVPMKESYMNMSHVTRIKDSAWPESCHAYEWLKLHSCVLIYIRALVDVDMGWLRLVSPLKLEVSFVKEPYKRDDVLQKRPTIWRSLLIHPISAVPLGKPHMIESYAGMGWLHSCWYGVTSLLV